jgi:hypothetical protein
MMDTHLQKLVVAMFFVSQIDGFVSSIHQESICTQGVDQDMRNVENILNYVKHFTHLNTICFFSQAGVDRRTSSMQYVFEQLFGYLDVKTKNNIAFVFTNARSSFYKPCSKFKIMKALFSEWETAQCVKIPFAQNNCFLFDSEAFRFSAAKKNCIEYRSCDEEMYHTSWNHSTKELRRLIDFVLKCPVYSTSGWNTLYEARDLAYRTARPIAELVRLIQENISLAKYYKDDLLRNPREQKSNRMTEISGRFIEVDQPLEECSNSTCIKMKKENHDVITDPAEYCSQKNTAAIQYRQSVNLFVMSRYKQFFVNHGEQVILSGNLIELHQGCQLSSQNLFLNMIHYCL